MTVEELKYVLDTQCRRESGKMVGHFSGPKYKKYENEIIHHTSFLNEYNPKLAERVYCIMNNIAEIVRCEISGEKMRFDSTERGYLMSHKNYHKWVYKKIWENYNNGSYNLLNKDECIKMFNKINCQYNDMVAYKNMSLTCSILHHTSFLLDDKFVIPQRIYCIENNINEILHDVNGNPRKFLNIKKGYQKHANMDSCHQKTREKIKNFLERDNFIIGGHLKETVI